jgi:hypothetical protein
MSTPSQLKFVQQCYGIKRAVAGILAYEIHTLVDRQGKTIGYEGQIKSRQRGTIIERVAYRNQAIAIAGLNQRARLLEPNRERRQMPQSKVTQ